MASVTSATLFSVTLNQIDQPEEQINIDLTNLKAWCGIKPDDIGMGDWMTDKDLPVVDANQAMNEMDLEKSQFAGEPSVEFTFQSAVRLVVAVINRNAKLMEGEEYILLSCPAAGGYLLRMLSNVETACPDLIAAPPLYGENVCSARSSDHNFWPGVVLQMLFEQGHISAYGRKGIDFWFSV